jgi:hypothetical protein
MFGILLRLFFYPEDGGDMFFRNISWLSMDYTALYIRRWHSSKFKYLGTIVTNHKMEFIKKLNSDYFAET